jgi:DNA-binding GntR family transcriptional regulator
VTVSRERVARAVRAAIVRGDYADGQHLSQDKLAAQYRVHRSVLRRRTSHQL